MYREYKDTSDTFIDPSGNPLVLIHDKRVEGFLRVAKESFKDIDPYMMHSVWNMAYSRSYETFEIGLGNKNLLSTKRATFFRNLISFLTKHKCSIYGIGVGYSCNSLSTVQELPLKIRLSNFSENIVTIHCKDNAFEIKPSRKNIDFLRSYEEEGFYFLDEDNNFIILYEQLSDLAFYF